MMALRRRVYLLLLVFLICNNKSFGQEKSVSIELAGISEMPYGPRLSGDSTFWAFVKGKLDTIPSLIEVIDDTTKSEAYVQFFGGVYSVGDIAVHIMLEVIPDVPINAILQNWDGYDETMGFGNYWAFVRENKDNRVELKEKLSIWFFENKDEFVWVNDDGLYLKEEKRGAVRYPHPSGGFYTLSD